MNGEHGYSYVQLIAYQKDIRSMLQVHLIDFLDVTQLDLPHLNVGLTNRKYPFVIASVLVENQGQAVMTIAVCGNPDGYFFRETALLWKAHVVVGAGHQVMLVNLTDHTSTTTELGCYFGYLYPENELLLVASASHLHCFRDDGKLRWTSKDLGIDGVVVDKITDGIVYGQGEWDPPGGWEPFTLNLETGEPVYSP
jgi:hypothetical protein